MVETGVVVERLVVLGSVVVGMVVVLVGMLASLVDAADWGRTLLGDKLAWLETDRSCCAPSKPVETRPKLAPHQKQTSTLACYL